MAAANTLALAIPCHRVVRGDGGLGGYRWGVARKRALLEREGALGAPRHSPNGSPANADQRLSCSVTGRGDHNALHQNVYGEVAFPFQVVRRPTPFSIGQC